MGNQRSRERETVELRRQTTIPIPSLPSACRDDFCMYKVQQINHTDLRIFFRFYVRNPLLLNLVPTRLSIPLTTNENGILILYIL